MPPNLPAAGSVRSAAIVNADIRALWARAGGQLGAAERREYEALVVEWAAAVRAEESAAAAA